MVKAFFDSVAIATVEKNNRTSGPEEHAQKALFTAKAGNSPTINYERVFTGGMAIVKISALDQPIGFSINSRSCISDNRELPIEHINIRQRS